MKPVTSLFSRKTLILTSSGGDTQDDENILETANALIASRSDLPSIVANNERQQSTVEKDRAVVAAESSSIPGTLKKHPHHKRRPSALAARENHRRVKTSRLQPRRSATSVDGTEFDSWNSTGIMDERLAAAEQGRRYNSRRRRGQQESKRRNRGPVFVSPECTPGGPSRVCSTKSGQRRSAGGLFSPRKQKDPDYEADGKVSFEKHWSMRLRSSSRSPKKNNKTVEVIDLTGEDDSLVASADSEGIPGQTGRVLLPPTTGKIIIGNPGPHLLLTPLDCEEEKLAEQLTGSLEDGALVSYIPSARITLRGQDFALLRATGWLNDELMNSYVALINDREARYRSAVSEGHRRQMIGRPRCHCFNTFFATRLMANGQRGEYDYKGVARWTKRAGVDILKIENVMFPVNVNGNHWVLVVLNVKRKESFFLDSLHGREKKGIVKRFQRWASDEIRNKHGAAAADLFDEREWREHSLSYRVEVTSSGNLVNQKDFYKKIPRQQDEGSCGVFVLKMAECIALGIKTYFTGANTRLLRQRIALELYNRVLRG